MKINLSCEKSSMRTVALLLIGVHLAYAARHSLQYFYTGVSDINFPEFTVAAMVDDGQFVYFDTNIMKAVPKTEWIRNNVGADYWDRETQNFIGTHQTFKNNIQILKERFNQTTGVHTFQFMYGCQWDEESGTIDGFDQYGYDGQDFITLDLKQLKYISPVQQGVITTQTWNNNQAKLDYNKQYYTTICIEWLKKYVQYGKSSLKRTVYPQVSLLQKDSSSPVTCHATGFYPSGVTISWMKDGQEHHEDVEVGELLPNEDGTYQKTSTLNVKPDEWKNNKFSCVVEHQGKSVTANEIITNHGNSALIGIIVGIVVAVLLIAIAVAGYMVYQKKKGFKPVNTSENGSNSSNSQTGA